MEMELMNTPSPARTRLQAQLRLYKSDQEKMKRDLRRLAASKASYQRQELLGDIESQHQADNVDAESVDQRQRLLSGADRLGESSRRLEQSHRMALETEGIGASILSTLKGQRETMTRARDTVSLNILSYLLSFYSSFFWGGCSSLKLIHILTRLLEL
ncbi:unnamed protein product [Absidia cylindrospora]